MKGVKKGDSAQRACHSLYILYSAARLLHNSVTTRLIQAFLFKASLLNSKLLKCALSFGKLSKDVRCFVYWTQLTSFFDRKMVQFSLAFSKSKTLVNSHLSFCQHPKDIKDFAIRSWPGTVSDAQRISQDVLDCNDMWWAAPHTQHLTECHQ